MMLYVQNQGLTDPHLNLAIEEHLLRNFDINEPIVFFYVNEPSVIVGRNQNVFEEIDPDFVKAQGIHVVRRLSGGGAVYHDLGNLNFSFITQGKGDLHKFAKVVDPIIKVLQDLGLEAEFRGKSDIFAAGKKISGNAQYSTAGRMFSHGTLLFDSDLDSLSKALNPRKMGIESKAVQSIRNHVVNIRDLLGKPMTIGDLQQALLRGLFHTDEIPTLTLTAADWEVIQEISAERYQQWGWNYGRSPKFSVSKSKSFPSGKIEVQVEVEDGRIQAITFSGQLAGQREVTELENSLIGLRYDTSAVAQALETVDLQPHLGPLDKVTLLDLLFR
jgi:lipoate-protein ligase A